jgi:hypothetical protein
MGTGKTIKFFTVYRLTVIALGNVNQTFLQGTKRGQLNIRREGEGNRIIYPDFSLPFIKRSHFHRLFKLQLIHRDDEINSPESG